MTRDRNEAVFMDLAITEARRSKHEDDAKPHPYVGAVAVCDGKIVASACRGDEAPGEHAEFTLLEKKFSKGVLAGSTIFTTLEPCTTRNHPKVPCADRLIERKVRRVVIGTLDPDQTITGQGVLRLRKAGIEVELFPPRLMAELEELNRAFTRFHTSGHRTEQATKVSVSGPRQWAGTVLHRIAFERDWAGGAGWLLSADPGQTVRAEATSSIDRILGPITHVELSPGSRFDHVLPTPLPASSCVSFVFRRQAGIALYVRVALRGGSGIWRDGWFTLRDTGLRAPEPFGDGFSEWAVPWEPRPLHDDWVAADVDVGELSRKTFAKVGLHLESLTGIRIRDRAALAGVTFWTSS